MANPNVINIKPLVTPNILKGREMLDVFFGVFVLKKYVCKDFTFRLKVVLFGRCGASFFCAGNLAILLELFFANTEGLLGNTFSNWSMFFSRCLLGRVSCVSSVLFLSQCHHFPVTSEIQWFDVLLGISFNFN